jgi:hypothetical protein
VSKDVDAESRFNGFTSMPKPLKRLAAFLASFTWLKPGLEFGFN